MSSIPVFVGLDCHQDGVQVCVLDQAGKQLSRFCGLTPRNASSGARQADAGLSKAGNPELRQVLIEQAHRRIRLRHAQWGQLASGMRAHGKPKNVVVAAVANRWVRWLYHELNRDTSLSEERPSARARQKGLKEAQEGT